MVCLSLYKIYVWLNIYRLPLIVGSFWYYCSPLNQLPTCMIK
jgi:hypothetical protein